MTTSLLYDQFSSTALLPGLALPVDYRTLPHVSNSDLTQLKEEWLSSQSVNYRSSTYNGATERTRTFGRAFHQHLLEPESVGTVLQQFLPDLTNGHPANVDAAQLDGLMEAVRQDPFCRRYLRRADRERVVLFTDPLTQLPCKARLDLVYTSPKRQQALIFDFKPTSARTQAQFLQSCYDYDYDRQAAFYLDSLRHADNGEWADTKQMRFVLIGVMKEAPHRLFAVDATSLPGFVDYGRKKYRFWLRKYQETNGLPD